MGQDKTLLVYEGVPLIRRTWNVARSLTPDIWIVTPWRDRYQPFLPLETQWIEEEVPSPDGDPPGPLVAFTQALAHLALREEDTWMLLLASDMPALQVSILQTWVENLSALPPTEIAYLPHTPQGWEPLCGFYRPDCLVSLQRYLDSGGRSFQAWLAGQSIVAIAPTPWPMLINCNTPADWLAFAQKQTTD
jgi:molybdopterin-guanine dinucleotide biosynthesis protein A